VALLGTIPIGGPIMGGLAQVLGGRTALVAAGLVAVTTVAVAWRALERADSAGRRPLRAVDGPVAVEPSSIVESADELEPIEVAVRPAAA